MACLLPEKVGRWGERRADRQQAAWGILTSALPGGITSRQAMERPWSAEPGGERLLAQHFSAWAARGLRRWPARADHPRCRSRIQRQTHASEDTDAGMERAIYRFAIQADSAPETLTDQAKEQSHPRPVQSPDMEIGCLSHASLRSAAVREPPHASRDFMTSKLKTQATAVRHLTT